MARLQLTFASMDALTDKMLLRGGADGEAEVVWALVELAAAGHEMLPIALHAADAVDAVSGDELEDGDLAYVLDDCIMQPLTHATLHRLILELDRLDNPFTRTRIARVILVRIIREDASTA